MSVKFVLQMKRKPQCENTLEIKTEEKSSEERKKSYF